MAFSKVKLTPSRVLMTLLNLGQTASKGKKLVNEFMKQISFFSPSQRSSIRQGWSWSCKVSLGPLSISEAVDAAVARQGFLHPALSGSLRMDGAMNTHEFYRMQCLCIDKFFLRG